MIASRLFRLAPLALLLAPTLQAQVGHLPTQSPYRDLEFHQELTGFGGYFAAAKDPAGVAPQGGGMIGARYEVRVGGPASLTVRAARAFSQRRIVDPSKPAASRDLGTQSWPLYFGDIGLAINLTGQKSFHHLVPVVSGGIGLVSDFQPEDVGGFKFGTTFAFCPGVGIRWVPGGRLQLRADYSDYLYQIRYPSSYFITASDSTSVLRSQSQGVWKNNGAFTVGASLLLFR